MKITKKQLVKAKRKVVIDFFSFEIIISIILILLVWTVGAIIAWSGDVGSWHIVGRVIFATVLGTAWATFNLSLITYSNKCFNELKTIRDTKGLDTWCLKYGFKSIN